MFNLSETKDYLNIVFSSELRNINKISVAIENFLKILNLGDKSFDIQLVMRELLNNAIIHGCHSNKEKIVSFRLQLDENVLVIDVEDEGDGFDWRNVIRQKPQVTSEHGRGLPILKHYCDYIWFNEKGNRLRVKIKVK